MVRAMLLSGSQTLIETCSRRLGPVSPKAVEVTVLPLHPVLARLPSQEAVVVQCRPPLLGGGDGSASCPASLGAQPVVRPQAVENGADCSLQKGVRQAAAGRV